jgi:hypothetical protein
MASRAGAAGSCADYSEWTAEFVANLTNAIRNIGPRDGVNPAEFAEATWAAILGCHLLSSALSDDPHARLSRAWRAMLRATLPEPAQRECYQLVERVAGGFQTVS